jgi:beta-N-acetylhexosaminidase
MTDDLEMGSIRDNWGVAEGAVAAFEAGADILLICHNQNNILEAINLLRDRIISEKIEFKRVLQSLERIEKAKSSFIRPDYQVSIKDVRRYFVEGLTTDMK